MADNVEGAAAPDGQTESDEALRRVYGQEAVFSRVGGFTLVHLDQPSEDEIKRRINEFNPDEFFFDDCPLCQSAKAEGGHVVFDGPERDDPLRDSSGSDSPAEAFERALAGLAVEAEVFTPILEAAVPEDLARRYRDDVAELHDRLVETLWSQDRDARIETFERQLARALTTLEAVQTVAPALAEPAKSVEVALAVIAAVWRSL